MSEYSDIDAGHCFNAVIDILLHGDVVHVSQGDFRNYTPIECKQHFAPVSSGKVGPGWVCDNSRS